MSRRSDIQRGSAVGQDDYAATSDACLAISGVAGWPGPRAGTSGPTGIMTRTVADDVVRPLHQGKPLAIARGGEYWPFEVP